MIDLGSGTPLVLIPGIQGRWEWIGPAAYALAARMRVVTGSLPGEPGSSASHEADRGFQVFVEHVDRLIDASGIGSAVICGVSFGGLVAAAYAARRPERVRALVLVSTPGPRWQPDNRAMRYMGAPWRFAPAFVARLPERLYPEVAAALPAWNPRLRFLARYVGRMVAAPMSPARMADRLKLAGAEDFVAACHRIAAPTLVVTGEPALDRVVPVSGMREYADLIRDARMAVIERTGHIGLVTRPDVFAELVGAFVDACAEERPARQPRTDTVAGRLEAAS